MIFKFKILVSLLTLIPFVFSALNGKCTGRNGICVSTTTCTNYNGISYTGKCPNDANNIKCCDNISCRVNGKTGSCKFSGLCSGTTYSGLCPGGTDFKCCVESSPSQTTPSSSSSSVKDLVTTLLIFEEGTHKNGACYPYKDSRGYPTIGYGKLCKSTIVKDDTEARFACSSLYSSCTPAKAKQWLYDEIDNSISCTQSYSNIKAAYDNASNKRKAIIVSMAYQLGCSGLSKFKNTLSLMAKGKWSDASVEMCNSAWHSQTTNRANRHAYVIKNDDCGNFCSNYGW